MILGFCVRQSTCVDASLPFSPPRLPHMNVLKSDSQQIRCDHRKRQQDEDNLRGGTWSLDLVKWNKTAWWRVGKGFRSCSSLEILISSKRHRPRHPNGQYWTICCGHWIKHTKLGACEVRATWWGHIKKFEMKQTEVPAGTLLQA